MPKKPKEFAAAEPRLGKLVENPDGSLEIVGIDPSIFGPPPTLEEKKALLQTMDDFAKANGINLNITDELLCREGAENSLESMGARGLLRVVSLADLGDDIS